MNKNFKYMGTWRLEKDQEKVASIFKYKKGYTKKVGLETIEKPIEGNKNQVYIRLDNKKEVINMIQLLENLGFVKF